MITHILKDGTVLEDITGHVIKQDDAPMVYQIIEQMEREGTCEQRTERAEKQISNCLLGQAQKAKTL